ncbi:MAG: hypothetical protein AABO58_23095 [Acidobacteriota bacterium]
MWSTLLSGNARDNFVFLFAQAAWRVQQRVTDALKREGLSPLDHAVFETFVFHTRPGGAVSPGNLKIFATRGPLADCVVAEMIRILVQLPYKKLRPA